MTRIHRYLFPASFLANAIAHSSPPHNQKVQHLEHQDQHQLPILVDAPEIFSQARDQQDDKAPPCHPEAVLLDPLRDVRNALHVMQSTWFELWVGTWPTSIDWTGAVLNTHVVAALGSLSKALEVAKASSHPSDDSMLKDIENEINLYFAQTAAYYFGENAFAIRNEAYDDMLWVVLGELESIKFVNTHSRLYYRPVDAGQSAPWHGTQYVQAFAHRARMFYDITTHGWSTDLCGGGMTWNPSLAPYKNAITNQLYIAASIGMYLYFPGDNIDSPFLLNGIQYADANEIATAHDPTYLQAAVDGYEWLIHSNMTNSQGLYVDGFHITNWGRRNSTSGTAKCDDRNEMVFTYNQGVLLSGLRGLWESTGNVSYLEDGHELIRNTIAASGWLLESASAVNSTAWQGLGRAGILEEICDSSGKCDQNGHTFKGIYFHHLSIFCKALPVEPLVPGLTHIANKTLALLHHRSCREYALWVAHNARAAVKTRDQEGRFGTWWGADSTTPEPEAVILPRGAVDYRNDASKLLQEPWRLPYHRFETRSSPSSSSVSTPSPKSSDPNTRGRGRTVESHSGGVAILRALWEFLNQT